MDENYISVKEAAPLLGLSRSKVWQAIQEGRLQATKFGRDWYVHRDSMAAYRAKGEFWEGVRQSRIASQNEE